MDADIVLHMRNYLILGSVVMAGSMVSEPFAIVAKPVLHLFSRIKHSMQVLRERIQCKCQNSFWEIDMTKFEP